MDYNKISRTNVKTDEISDELIHDDLVEDAVVETESIRSEGVVDFCEKVYMRTRPNKNSNPIKILNAGTKLVIDTENSSEYFYKIIIDDEHFGYVMKNFVRLV